MLIRRVEYDRRSSLPRVIETTAGRMDTGADYLSRLVRQSVHLKGDVARAAASIVSPGGRVTGATHVDGSHRAIDRDDLGRPVSVRDGDVLVAFAYDSLSRLAQRVTRVDDRRLAEAFAYDALGRVHELSITTDGATSLKRRISFTWRADGKMSTRIWQDDNRVLRAERMAYDARGRLVAHVITEADEDELPRDEVGNAYIAQSFTYDAIDNLVAARTELLSGEVDVATYEYDGTDRDRLLRIVHGRPEYGPPVSFAYDDDGNVVNDGLGRVYGWDGAGRLDSVTRADGNWQYRHGPGGRVCAILNGGHILFRYHEDGALVTEIGSTEERRYVRCGAAIVAESRLTAAIRETWLLGDDPQGNVLIEAGDSVARTRTYGAFGARDASTDAVQSGFTGDTFERASGCYLLGNRLYSPTLRRFLNPDPRSPIGAGGFNRYAYCGGDPVNRVDPSGNSWLPIFFSALGLAAAFLGAVASAGALSGAVAAAGGELAVMLSTPSMAAATIAVVLETVSVVAEATSLAALATGNDGLATTFGALAFGSGIASAGLSVLTSAVARSARFVGLAGASRGNVGPGRSIRPMGGASSSMRHAEPPRQFTFMQLHEIGTERLSIHPSKPEWVVEPIFHTFRHPSNRLSIHHFVDSTIYNDMIPRAAESIRSSPLRRTKTAVYVYAGVHGEYKKPNFGATRRNPDLDAADQLEEQRYWFRELQNILGDDFEVFPENVGKMSRDAYRNAMERTGHHLHWFCYSLADNVAIAEIRIPANIPLSVYPVPTGT